MKERGAHGTGDARPARPLNLIHRNKVPTPAFMRVSGHLATTIRPVLGWSFNQFCYGMMKLPEGPLRDRALRLATAGFLKAHHALRRAADAAQTARP